MKSLKSFERCSYTSIRVMRKEITKIESHSAHYFSRRAGQNMCIKNEWNGLIAMLSLSGTTIERYHATKNEVLYKFCDNVSPSLNARGNPFFSLMCQVDCRKLLLDPPMLRSACGITAYCSRKCQKHEWKNLKHRAVCNALCLFRSAY